MIFLVMLGCFFRNVSIYNEIFLHSFELQSFIKLLPFLPEVTLNVTDQIPVVVNRISCLFFKCGFAHSRLDLPFYFFIYSSGFFITAYLTNGEWLC